MNLSQTRPVEILLIEDCLSDATLTIEALRDGRIANNVARVADGVEAMAYLRRQCKYDGAIRPDLVMLDLNLPRKDGREVLEELKADAELKTIPVIVLTTSASDKDISRSYDLHANCFITKPVDYNQFTNVVRSIELFWLTVVTLPQKI